MCIRDRPSVTSIEHVFEVAVGQSVQLVKVCPVSGVAVSTIVSPTLNCAPHADAGQLIPPGTLVTEPAPIRLTVTTAFAVLPPGQTESVGSFTVTVATVS